MSIVFRFPLYTDEIQIGHWVFALLRRFNHEHAIRLLLATHIPALAARCDKAIQIVDGMVTK